jgi:hypothetical protein
VPNGPPALHDPNDSCLSFVLSVLFHSFVSFLIFLLCLLKLDLVYLDTDVRRGKGLVNLEFICSVDIAALW